VRPDKFSDTFGNRTRDLPVCSAVPQPLRHHVTLALVCTTALFYLLTPTCFGSSLQSSGSFLDLSELFEIQIEYRVYHVWLHEKTV
jgi:hypothetical protein